MSEAMQEQEKKRPAAITPFTVQSNTRLNVVKSANRLAFSDVRNRIAEVDKRAKDIHCRVKDMQFIVNGFPTGVGVKVEGREYGMTPWAMSQLGGRLEVPASFLWKLYHRKQSDLIRKNLGVLREIHGEQEVRLRTVVMPEGIPFVRGKRLKKYEGAVIRGILTPTFTPVDNIAIVDALEEVLPDSFRTSEWQADFESLVLRLVDKNVGIRERGKAGMFAGGLFESSEVGRRSLLIDVFIYRLVCTNGMVVPQAVYHYQRRHTGDALDEFREEVTKNFLPQMGNITNRIEEASKAAQAKKLSVSKMKKFFEDALDETNGAKALLFQTPRDEMVKRMMETVKHEATLAGGYNRWAAVNTLTRLAQGLPTDRRHDVESHVGKLLLASK